jgi:hypothetical protein
VSGEEVDRAVRRIEARRPDLNMAVQAVAGGLTAGEGAGMIHQAALQQFLWWHLPRDYPGDEWRGLVEATALLLDELGLKHLAELARSSETQKVLAAWRQGREKGAAAFRAAHAKSGVEPPDTTLLAWGSIMGVDEVRALDIAERALGDAIAAGNLVPGAPHWHAKAASITEAVLSQPRSSLEVGWVSQQLSAVDQDFSRTPAHVLDVVWGGGRRELAGEPGDSGVEVSPRGKAFDCGIGHRKAGALTFEGFQGRAHQFTYVSTAGCVAPQIRAPVPVPLPEVWPWEGVSSPRRRSAGTNL